MIAQLSLRPSAAVAERSKDPADPDVFHPPIIDRVAYLAVVGLAKRLARNRSIGWLVEPLKARSARISPITGANLKPWPEQAEA
jgi:hypothetical protein